VLFRSHALYEQADPFEVDEPTGTLLLQQAQYQALDAHRTRVSGAQWRPRGQATLKIEGAARVGERCVLLAGVADPTLLAQLDNILQAVEMLKAIEIEFKTKKFIINQWVVLMNRNIADKINEILKYVPGIVQAKKLKDPLNLWLTYLA
jgi:hypothetical protein